MGIACAKRRGAQGVTTLRLGRVRRGEYGEQRVVGCDRVVAFVHFDGEAEDACGKRAEDARAPVDGVGAVTGQPRARQVELSQERGRVELDRIEVQQRTRGVKERQAPAVEGGGAFVLAAGRVLLAALALDGPLL